jgi:NSS family neurotransmitter:Na+ symporter
VIIDVFYDTILPLNGFIICLFVIYRWQRKNFNAELSVGDDDFEGSFVQKYINFSVGTFIPVVLLLVFINTVCIKFFGLNSLMDIF